MTVRAEHLKDELIDRIKALVEERRSGPERGEIAFVGRVCAAIPTDDILGADIEQIYGSVMALWRLAQHRRPGTAVIRVHTPHFAEHGWSCDHSVIEVVNDDMPFLVDSLTAALTARDIAVHLLVHPVLTVLRGADGTLRSVEEPGRTAEGTDADHRVEARTPDAEPGPAGEPGLTVAESVMHIEISRQPDARSLADLQADLQAVLDDVRRAVTDWQPMRARVAELAASLRAVPADDDDETPAGPDARADAEARADGADFLDWLRDDHFTLLGCLDLVLGPGPGPRGGAQEGMTGTAESLVADPATGLGLLRDPRWRPFAARQEAGIHGRLAAAADPVQVTKGDGVATVHRRATLDVIAVRRLAPDGRPTGLALLCGLFTSDVYTGRPASIPLLRRKVERVVTRAGFRPHGHDAKALLFVIDNLPRDELFEASEDEIAETAQGIVALQERQRVALFVREDRFGRFVSCLVFVPRDRYDTTLRLRIQHLLEHAFDGPLLGYSTQVGDQPLARLHFVIRRPIDDRHLPPDGDDIERRIVEATRSWTERLRRALIDHHGEGHGLVLWRRYATAFPAGYRERFPARAAVHDIDRLEEALAGSVPGLHLYRPLEATGEEVRLKIYHARRALPLSDVLPMLEAMGFRVIEEVPFAIRPGPTAFADSSAASAGSLDGDLQTAAAERSWIHDFGLLPPAGRGLDLDRVRQPFADALAAVWTGAAESDRLNRLVLLAGRTWGQVMVLRAYTRYLRQTAFPFSQAYVEDAMAAQPAVAALLIDLFEARFDPRLDPATRAERTAALGAAVQAALDSVASPDEDRILRRFVTLITATVRTNAFQRDADGRPKPALALKLDSRAVDDLPQPRPLVETFIHGPRVEAIHLRGGRVARGGIRWSERREDFRTEVLDLMKAQMVKNAVIVPVGAKGGFVVRKPPGPGPGDSAAVGSAPDRAALEAEGIACYRMMIAGLLDITDTLEGSDVVPPVDVVRHDGDDPYLVVAADKGTARFSDIANALAVERGFWLGDAFASGGSNGYDHKAMGITARGAWESVRRHFRERGRDPEREPFTVVGIGDMSGDVFGNGMLQSDRMLLIGAFDHRHILIDPTPDAIASYRERQRLFGLPRSSWADYDRRSLSPGGTIIDRGAKTVRLSVEARALLGIGREGDASPPLTPADVIRALLRVEVDLLSFGGIGTYVKATGESHAEVGDKVNDALRIDATELKARVVVEGANLGLTQRGRIEAALAGVRLNTDAIDNSAGVDCSDHEVNIKIVLDDAVTAGHLTVRRRNDLLAAMTDEVARLVLTDNILQVQAISLAEADGADGLDRQDRLMRQLERARRLDRRHAHLPDTETLAARQAARIGLARPELAVLLAHAKLWLFDVILNSSLPDEPVLIADLVRYFPRPLRADGWRPWVEGHRLRREIIATVAANDMVNRVGGAFVSDMAETTGMPPAEVARACLVSREAFAVRSLWAAIDALGSSVPAAMQIRLHWEANRLLGRATRWTLRHGPRPLDLGAAVAVLAPGVTALSACLDRVVPEDMRATLEGRAADYRAAGVPDALAERVARLMVLASANDVVRLASACRTGVEEAARAYFAVGARFGLGWLRGAAERVVPGSYWQRLAVGAVIDDLYGVQRDLTLAILGTPERTTDGWIAANVAVVERTDRLVAELQLAARVDLAMLTVAARQMRQMIGG